MLLLFCLCGVCAEEAIDPRQKEIQEIDVQIEKLKKERDLYAQKSLEYQRQGDQWKYTTGYVQDAYDAWAKADAERRKMIETQNEIESLEEKRARLQRYW